MYGLTAKKKNQVYESLIACKVEFIQKALSEEVGKTRYKEKRCSPQ